MLVPVLAWLASLGFLLVRLRAGHRVGWLFLVAALDGVVVFLAFGVVGLGAEAVPGLAGAASASGGALLIVFVVTLVGFLPLLFPDGRLPGPGWRLPVATLVGLLGVSTLGMVLGIDRVDPGTPPNPLAIAWLPAWVGTVGVASGVLAMAEGTILGVASVAIRFRRGHGDERQQVKWMLGAIVLFAVATVPTFVGVNSDLLGLVAPVTLALIPAAVTLAILRYRLYDIDRLISRTIAYSLVTVVLLATFVLGNLALQALLANVTSRETLAVAGSTLVAFAAFQPIRRRIQAAVDRRFDRSRVDTARTVAAFSARQRDAVDPEAVIEDIRATADGSLRPASTGIWLREAAARSGGGAGGTS